MSERYRRANALGPVGEQLRANLVRLRQSRSMSTSALAEKMTSLGRPVYANTITKIEKGIRRVDVDDLAVLAEALQVTVPQLIEPPSDCQTCHGAPPPGFVCAACSGLTPVTP